MPNFPFVPCLFCSLSSLCPSTRTLADLFSSAPHVHPSSHHLPIWRPRPAKKRFHLPSYHPPHYAPPSCLSARTQCRTLSQDFLTSQDTASRLGPRRNGTFHGRGSAGISQLHTLHTTPSDARSCPLPFAPSSPSLPTVQYPSNNQPVTTMFPVFRVSYHQFSLLVLSTP